MEKQFKTIDEQIKLLKNRGLVFHSVENAKAALMTYGYYEIINGYKTPFLMKEETDKFIEHTTFEEVYSLFNFDKNLRLIVMNLVQEIEANLRSIVSYRIAEKFGHNEKDYLKRTNYKPGKKYPDGYKLDQLLSKMNLIISDDTQPFKHYREVHGHCPPWILLKGTTFGNLANFIKLQKSDLKNQIISDFLNLPKVIIENDPEIKQIFMEMIFVLVKYRNRAAHGGRIYNYEPQGVNIKYCQLLHSSIKIDEASYRKGYGHNDWNAILGFIELMKNGTAREQFKDMFLEVLNHYLSVSNRADYILREDMRILPSMVAIVQK